MAASTQTHVALAKIHEWITVTGRETGSARTLRRLLLSMAGEGRVTLLGLHTLDSERRAWVAALVAGFHEITPEELKSAAGGVKSEEG